jgi:hypothetical protein
MVRGQPNRYGGVVFNMNAKILLGIAALVCLAAAAAPLVGCQRSAASPRIAATAQEPPARTGDAAPEYKTVEVVESPDEEQAIAQLKERQQQFQREGWAVLSVSKPLPQSDGTIHRQYTLSRAKQ